MKAALKQYEVATDDFWEGLPARGGDGYDDIQEAQEEGWHTIPAWGKDGWNLGKWPYIIIFSRKLGETFQIAYYVEGDVTMYTCPTKDIRNAIIDELAFFHWKHKHEEWVQGYESVDQLPEKLKGPYGA